MKLYFLFPLILQKVIWVPTRLIFIIFGRMKIRGLENLNGIPDRVIFACNHASEIDPFIIPASLPLWSRFSPLFYATRERSFYSENGWRKYLFGGLFINAWGGYTAIAGLNDYEKSLANHIAIARDGGSFCIYPEGGITRTGAIQSAKGGLAYLAERGDCIIIPVGVSGTFRIPFTDFFLGRRNIIVNFGMPITQQELRSRIVRTPELGISVYRLEAEYVMSRVGELLEQISVKEEKKEEVEELQKHVTS